MGRAAPGRRIGGGLRQAGDGGRPPVADGRLLGDLVDGGQADESVHDPASSVCFTKLEADERGHKVEFRDRDKTPVEASYDHEDGGEDVELLHVPLLVEGLYKERTA